MSIAKHLLALALAAASVAAPAQTATDTPVEIRFAAQVSGEEFECGKTYKAMGSTRSNVTPSDFRFYVSEVRLINSQGTAVPLKLQQDGVWQLEDLALIDFENAAGPCRNGTSGMNTRVRGSVPAGNYVGMELVVGVPFRLNHRDATIAPAPLNSTAMFWNWQGGYKFVKVDMHTSGLPDSDASAAKRAPGFSVHLGSTQCTPVTPTQASGGCKNENRVLVRFDRFDPAVNTVVADLGRLLSQTNLDVNATGTAPGCMSGLGDADCPPVMAAFGLSYEGRAAPAQVFLTSR